MKIRRGRELAYLFPGVEGVLICLGVVGAGTWCLDGVGVLEGGFAGEGEWAGF